jgi:hypothetical protein
MRPRSGYRWRRAALHWAPLVVAVVGVFAGMREGGSLFDTVFYLFLGAPSTHRLLLALRQVRASVPETSIEPPPARGQQAPPIAPARAVTQDRGRTRPR